MKFGAHMSTSGGIWKALERGLSIQCESVQIFVKNNMQWAGRAFTTAEVGQFEAQRKLCKFSCIFGHTGYLINLGAPPSPNREKSLQSLIQEMELAASLGLPFLVLHPGAHLGDGEEKGIERIVAGLDEACRATRSSKVRIALENTAGQGTCLGNKIEHLARIFDRVQSPERLGVCLDTAHFFAAGYDLRQPPGWDTAIGEVESMLGLKQIVAFHLNDSKTDLGSRVDRHAGIGQGKIGREAFRHIVNDPRFENHPACLETPKSEDMHEDVENLAVLRSLMRASNSTAKRTAKPPKSRK
ncbi:MAG: deoxyribonuclease IV [Verrucomicrobiota bacterium]